MRFFSGSRFAGEQRLLWARDIRFANLVADEIDGAIVIELESGIVVIAPANELTDQFVAETAVRNQSPQYGLVTLDSALPEGARHIAALSAAVQLSGLADRIGMAPTTRVVQTKTLDYFFSLRNVHEVAFQPIISLASGELYEHECLFRPNMPMLPQSISAVVRAAIDTERSVELDSFIVKLILTRAGEVNGRHQAAGEPPLRIAINFTPASLLDGQFEARAFSRLVAEAGLSPRQITLECTEQQAVSDVVPLMKQVKALRRLGFGFAVDDAGAGYASFTLIAALRPSVIKIDREIAYGIARDDAKQALVEAFVSFGRRIGARLLAEGIERRADMAKLSELRVDYGQGFLIGRPSLEPAQPRAIEVLRTNPRNAAPRAVRANSTARPRALGAD